jgi:hypothetical protein
MKTHLDLETENQFTGGNQGNGGGVQRAGKALDCPAPSRGKPSKSLRYLRFLLFHSRSHTVLALAAMLAAAAALLPAAAHAQAIEAWVQRYNGPVNGDDWATRAIAVDTNGNVYVTGLSYGGDALYGGSGNDWATIKYSSSGEPLWTNRYNGPGNGYDQAYALALGASGNVAVTGQSSGGSDLHCTTIEYSSDGVPLWTNRSTAVQNSVGSALAVDSSGNVLVTGSGYVGSDFLTIKYSGAGVPLWTKRYSGPGNARDEAQAVMVDGSGNAVVAGRSWNSMGGCYYITIKYSSAGVPLWTNLYGGGNDLLFAMAQDGSGNVVVTGRSQGTWNDYLTIKYSGAGVPLWTNRYNGPGNGTDDEPTLAVDASGSVIVTGTSEVGGYISCYGTIKYSSAGVPLWTNFYNGPGNGGGAARAVAVDASGNVYVTGHSDRGDGPSSWDFATVAYSSSGVPLWTNRYNGPGNDRDEARAVAVDASGSVYVTGYSTGSGSGSDFATIKYVVPPVIARQPLSCTNAVGTTASFTVEAAGGVPLTYQWRRQGTNLVNGVTVSGVTTTNLLVANIQLADAAGYTVVVTNVYGSMTSHVAQLTVYVPPNPGRFTSLSYSPATGFSFIFRDATVGQPYRIQRSPSMAEGSWTNWQSFTYTEPVGLMDVGATGAERRFYRAISP